MSRLFNGKTMAACCLKSKAWPTRLVRLEPFVFLECKELHISKQIDQSRASSTRELTWVASVTLISRMEPEPEHVVPAIPLGSYTQLLTDNRNFRRFGSRKL